MMGSTEDDKFHEWNDGLVQPFGTDAAPEKYQCMYNDDG